MNEDIKVMSQQAGWHMKTQYGMVIARPKVPNQVLFNLKMRPYISKADLLIVTISTGLKESRNLYGQKQRSHFIGAVCQNTILVKLNWFLMSEEH